MKILLLLILFVPLVPAFANIGFQPVYQPTSLSGGSPPAELYCIFGDFLNSYNSTTNSFTCATAPTGNVYENNTASNIGLGQGLFKQKTGVNLEFKNIAVSGDLSIASNGTDVTISYTDGVGSGDNLGNHIATTTLDMQNNIIDNVNYIQSNNANPASIGTMRMGAGEALAWRNNANTDNNYFYFSSVDALTVTINSVGEYQLTPLSLNFAGNNATNVDGIGMNGDKADSGFLQMRNSVQQCWEASPTGTDQCVGNNTTEDWVWDSAWNVINFGLNPFNNAVFDVAGTGNRLTSTSTALGDILKSDGTDFKRLARGSANQVLKVNAGGTDIEWGTDAGATPRGGYLVAHWTQSQTKTNIGTSFVNVYPQTNSNGKAILIDTDTFTEVRLQIQWNKVGTGTQTCQAINGATALVSMDVVSGSNDSGFVAIPAGLLNAENEFRIQCKSDTGTDDPVFESGSLWLK